MVQGLKIPEVTDWLLSHVDGLAAPLRFELISGGRSNLTYAVTSADGGRLSCGGRRSAMSCPRRTTWRASTG